ncbi:hypothetical protein HANVADRAFT_777 [Hanseniaspora valbyensis NRRL Y-1626]|uniref:Uncharacterized protein n=1 Tax=Hanseniaspora valbyensis NRRL Y-1626 TaxID=766949 RepID=A0A1B7TIQ9_9ASCO|nr:hypothetical protein HANVADRAFT_777 [Hanseniaspora valbyensis NRRL Y-1626]
MDSSSKSDLSIKEKNVVFFSDDIFKINNETSIKKQLDSDIEREIAQSFFNILQEHSTADFLTIHIPFLFASLGISEDFIKLTLLKHYKNLTIDNTTNGKIIDFDKILHYIHKLLIFMENHATILEYWKLVLFNVPLKRESIEKFDNLEEINWFMQILNVKDLKSIEEMDKISANLIKNNKKEYKSKVPSTASQTFLVALKMINVASSTDSLYITYLDFAHLLGKLGLLEY